MSANQALGHFTQFVKIQSFWFGETVNTATPVADAEDTTLGAILQSTHQKHLT